MERVSKIKTNVILLTSGSRKTPGEIYQVHSIAFSLILSVIIILFSGSAYTRNIVWMNEVTLWEDVVKKSPLSGRGHYNLGNAYKHNGLLDKAISTYLIAINYQNSYSGLADTFNNLGRIYEEKGLKDYAVNAYERAVQYNPDSAVIHNNLGLLYLDKKRLADAVRQFVISIKHEPLYAKAHLNLGRVLELQGLHDEAYDEFQKAYALDASLQKLMDSTNERTR